MASLLVRGERGVLDAIRARASGEQTELQRGELLQPELSYLDPQSVAFVVLLEGGTLRCVMTVHEPVLERGKLVGGDVKLHDHDLTPILGRLGCIDPRQVGEWSAAPRVLPPNDVDLLRYELGLPLDAQQNLVLEATMVAPEDEQDREILSEIWAAPDDDGPRMTYADRLQQRNDPRGELIALQLARGDRRASGLGDGRISERERALVAKWGAHCIRPLGNFLASSELRRGFLAHAIVDERQPFPPSLLRHPMWSLVEQLQTSHTAVLRTAPLTSLRVLRVIGMVLAHLSNQSKPYPRVETLLGPTVPQQPYRGIQLHELAAWQQIGACAVWPALRVLSIDLATRQGQSIPAAVLRSKLGARLAHLDLTIDAMFDHHALFAELMRNPTIQRVSVLARFEATVLEPIAVIYDRAGDRFAMTIQVPPYGAPGLRAAAVWLEGMAGGIDRATLSYVAVPGKTHDLAAERGLIADLSTFVALDVVDELRRPQCPWAYSAGVPSTFRL